MKLRHQLTFVVTAGVLGVIAVAAGCGGSKSTASQSAAEYDAARAKGEPVKTEEHGGHSASQASVAETASPGTPTDHASMGHEAPTSPATRPGRESGMAGMAGMDHSTMDRSKMPGRKGETSMAGMDHSSMPMPSTQRRGPGRGAATDHGQMAGMAHGAAAGMQHRSSAMDHSRMTEAGARTMPGMGQSHPAQPGASTTTGHMDHSTMAGPPSAAPMAGMTHGPTTSASSMPAMQHATMTSPLPEPPARTAAPAARQTTDRFHLVQNLRETIERELALHRAYLRVRVTPDGLPAEPRSTPALDAPVCPPVARERQLLPRVVRRVERVVKRLNCVKRTPVLNFAPMCAVHPQGDQFEAPPSLAPYIRGFA